MSQKATDAYINGMHGIGYAEYVLVQGHYEYQGEIKMDSPGTVLSLFDKEYLEYDGRIIDTTTRHKSHDKLRIMISNINNNVITFVARIQG